MMRGSLRALGRDDAGVEAIEFALIGFAFFVMLFGIFELGRLASAQSTLVYGTDVAVRYAATHSSTSAAPATAASIGAIFAGAVAPVLGKAAANPSVSYSPNDAPGSTVTIAAQYAWAPVGMGTVFGPVVLSARSSLVIEH